ncbi:hypothetical protein M426DRAFT_262626, partial [Hypoxylon sp. CI-4A]
LRHWRYERISPSHRLLTQGSEVTVRTNTRLEVLLKTWQSQDGEETLATAGKPGQALLVRGSILLAELDDGGADGHPGDLLGGVEGGAHVAELEDAALGVDDVEVDVDALGLGVDLVADVVGVLGGVPVAEAAVGVDALADGLGEHLEAVAAPGGDDGARHVGHAVVHPQRRVEDAVLELLELERHVLPHLRQEVLRLLVRRQRQDVVRVEEGRRVARRGQRAQRRVPLEAPAGVVVPPVGVAPPAVQAPEVAPRQHRQERHHLLDRQHVQALGVRHGHLRRHGDRGQLAVHPEVGAQHAAYARHVGPQLLRRPRHPQHRRHDLDHLPVVQLRRVAGVRAVCRHHVAVLARRHVVQHVRAVLVRVHREGAVPRLHALQRDVARVALRAEGLDAQQLERAALGLPPVARRVQAVEAGHLDGLAQLRVGRLRDPGLAVEGLGEVCRHDGAEVVLHRHLDLGADRRRVPGLVEQRAVGPGVLGGERRAAVGGPLQVLEPEDVVRRALVLVLGDEEHVGLRVEHLEDAVDDDLLHLLRVPVVRHDLLRLPPLFVRMRSGCRDAAGSVHGDGHLDLEADGREARLGRLRDPVGLVAVCNFCCFALSLVPMVVFFFFFFLGFPRQGGRLAFGRPQELGEALPGVGCFARASERAAASAPEYAADDVAHGRTAAARARRGETASARFEDGDRRSAVCEVRREIHRVGLQPALRRLRLGQVGPRPVPIAALQLGDDRTLALPAVVSVPLQVPHGELRHGGVLDFLPWYAVQEWQMLSPVLTLPVYVEKLGVVVHGDGLFFSTTHLPWYYELT